MANNRNEFTDLLCEIETEGMSQELYERVANAFARSPHTTPTACLTGILRHFVEFDGVAVYVNEIKDYLKEADSELFLAYGRRFQDTRGCFEVFGITPTGIKECSFRIEDEPVECKMKEYREKKGRKDNYRRARREARAYAIDQRRERTEQKTEKKKNQDEMKNLMRKQDL